MRLKDRLKNTAVLVPGGGTGIGGVISLTFGAEGATVADTSDEEWGRTFEANPTSTRKASNARVIKLTKSMALDYARQGVRVTAVCPACIQTDLNRDHLGSLKPSGAYDALEARHPPELGRHEDVAWAAVHLASDEVRWVTGVALPLDGGVLAGL